MRLLLTFAMLLSALALALSLNLSAAVALPEVPLSAAEGPQATATAEPVEECPEWKTAGDQIIYKCDDPDAMVTCWQPAGGVMQCVPYQ